MTKYPFRIVLHIIFIRFLHPLSLDDFLLRCFDFLVFPELHNLYSSPSIIRMILSRRMRWAGHVVRMGKERNAYRIFGERTMERDHWGDQGVGGWTI
jgi:hypothetical protein